MKYIVKNCPAYQKELITMDYKTGKTKVTDKHYCLNPFLPNDCTKCIDCLLKRIVEKCKEQACHGIDCAWCSNNCNLELVNFAKKILELLEIEECKNE